VPHPAEAVVFAGDGPLISQWGGYLEAADVPPTMIVGADRTDDEDEMARIREYSPSCDEERFAAHGDHGDPFWQAEFPLVVAWAFGR
jgi:hypothetical protein